MELLNRDIFSLNTKKSVFLEALNTKQKAKIFGMDETDEAILYQAMVGRSKRSIAASLDTSHTTINRRWESMDGDKIKELIFWLATKHPDEAADICKSANKISRWYRDVWIGNKTGGYDQLRGLKEPTHWSGFHRGPKRKTIQQYIREVYS